MLAYCDNNELKTSALEQKLSVFFSTDTFVVKGIREGRAYDEEQKKYTGPIEYIVYSLVNPESLSSIKVKVPAAHPVISPDELEASDEPVYVRLPLDKTMVRPYEIKYGTAKVSITAPSIEKIPKPAK